MIAQQLIADFTGSRTRIAVDKLFESMSSAEDHVLDVAAGPAVAVLPAGLVSPTPTPIQWHALQSAGDETDGDEPKGDEPGASPPASSPAGLLGQRSRPESELARGQVSLSHSRGATPTARPNLLAPEQRNAQIRRRLPVFGLVSYHNVCNKVSQEELAFYADPSRLLGATPHVIHLHPHTCNHLNSNAAKQCLHAMVCPYKFGKLDSSRADAEMLKLHLP